MTKDVSVSIRNLQTDPTGTKNSTDLSVTGQFFDKEGKIYILYEEYDSEAHATVKTSLKIDGEIITLSKSGNIRTKMTFNRNESTLSEYITPFGTLHFNIQTQKISVDLQEHSCTIILEYTFGDESGIIASNHLEIHCREREK